ncbi:Uncharacterised protein [Serratia ficaria]|nr:Uncharacterised protein [Serratia ficaria]
MKPIASTNDRLGAVPRNLAGAFEFPLRSIRITVQGSHGRRLQVLGGSRFGVLDTHIQKRPRRQRDGLAAELHCCAGRLQITNLRIVQGFPILTRGVGLWYTHQHIHF